MKKLFFSILSLALIASTASFAQEAYVAGGFEASGHMFFGSGWQRSIVEGAGVPLAVDVRGNIPGVIGAYAHTNAAAGLGDEEDHFKFFLDEVELDVAKTFGENIRLRTDLDFGADSLYSGNRFASAGGAADGTGILLEQAYATTNIAVGNGMELLLGRFNAPHGFESVDVGENDTISRSAIYRALRPQNYTGAKVYYAFSDLVDFHLFVANNGLAHDDGDVVNANTDIPAVGTRLGFNWGEEGRSNRFGFSGAWGQDNANSKTGYSFLADADFQWWATDSFAVGGEGIWRQIDSITAGLVNGKYYGGLLNLHYDFSDVWDGTLRYAYTHDVNGGGGQTVRNILTAAGLQSLTGADQSFHELALAGNYVITDGAMLKLEGGYTMSDRTGTLNNHVFGVVGGFAYAF